MTVFPRWKGLTRLSVLLLLASAGGLAGESVTYSVGDSAYEGYYEPASDSRGLILLVHDWDGLTDYEKRRARMLAEHGYSVFAADLFGAGVRPEALDDKRRLTGALYEDREQMRALMLGALNTARGLGANGDAVAMGYCFGGTAILELARSGAELAGFASFHGGLATPDNQSYADTKGPVAVYHGSADRAVSMQQFAALAEELESAGITHEMTTYSGAPHAFSVFGSPRYQERADTKSWAAYLEFLDETL